MAFTQLIVLILNSFLPLMSIGVSHCDAHKVCNVQSQEKIPLVFVMSLQRAHYCAFVVVRVQCFVVFSYYYYSHFTVSREFRGNLMPLSGFLALCFSVSSLSFDQKHWTFAILLG
jgi:hypothetical protein